MTGFAECLQFCRERLAAMLDVEPASIAPDATFASLGLDSATAVHFVLELEQWTGREFSPSLTYDYPSVEQLAAHIAGK